MRIKKSTRGLTFSFAENEKFRVGTKYRYVVDVQNSEVIILADDVLKSITFCTENSHLSCIT